MTWVDNSEWIKLTARIEGSVVAVDGVMIKGEAEVKKPEKSDSDKLVDEGANP